MKQYKIIIFLCGSNWWRLNSKIWTSGSIQGMIHIVEIGEKYVHYGFYDAGDSLRILGECHKAERVDNPQLVLYTAYARYINTLAMRGRIHKLNAEEVSYYDRISDEGKDLLQIESEKNLLNIDKVKEKPIKVVDPIKEFLKNIR
jgi:Fe2+ or Zn2+ uptake regulation protein